MREAVRRIVLRCFPEIASGYHLDRFAKIIKIAEPPQGGEVCDRFNPHFAADIQIITPDGEPVEGEKYEAVALPLPMGGQEEGFFLYPRPGTICTVGWIEGRPDHPVIKHIYPMGLKLPPVPDNMARWQQRPGVHQTIDPGGNWERKTDKDIADIAENISETAQANRHETTGNNSTENVGKNSTETVGQKKLIEAGQKLEWVAPFITIRTPDGTVDFLPTLTDILDCIWQALDIIADHTHPTVGVIPDQTAAIHGKADCVESGSGAIKSVQG